MGELPTDGNAEHAVGATRDAATQLRQSSRTGPPVGPFEPAEGNGEPGIRTMSPRCHRAGHDQCSRRVLPNFFSAPTSSGAAGGLRPDSFAALISAPPTTACFLAPTSSGAARTTAFV